MQETRDPKSSETARQDDKPVSREPGSSATSADTLNEIEREEAGVASEEHDSSPSPDGTTGETTTEGGGGPVSEGPM